MQHTRRFAGDLGAQSKKSEKFGFIDAIRGYAVLCVILSHVGNSLPELPYPLAKLSNFGWNGVQLFFLTSCVTLLISWRSDERRGRINLQHFFIRRICRILPMYFLAGILYFFVKRPPDGFSTVQALSSLTFVNAWHPLLLPTVADRWSVVPGGWSISVEFSFYVLFPFVALRIRTARAALLCTGVAFLIACLANTIAAPLLGARYGEVAAGRFLYYWFPAQLPVFLMGTVLFGLITALRAQRHAAFRQFFGRHSLWLGLLCLGACLGLAELPLPSAFPSGPPFWVPRAYLATLVFAVFTTVLACSTRSVFLSRPIRALGEVSFSAYLLHFAVIDLLFYAAPHVFDRNATGWAAIEAYVLLAAAVLPITFAISRLTYLGIERPMIAFGRRLCLPAWELQKAPV